jgi:hypothetical protein
VVRILLGLHQPDCALSWGLEDNLRANGAESVGSPIFKQRWCDIFVISLHIAGALH